MQFAKDSFYIALRDRLAVVNPARTVNIDGNSRPGILAGENERPGMDAALTGVLCLSWGKESAIAASGVQPEMRVLECAIDYRVQGTDEYGNADRGRQLTAMDSELLSIALPASAPKCDYTQTPVVALGTVICWTRPRLGPVKSEGKLLARTANLEVYFFPEGA